MLYIAICDDDRKETENITVMLNRFSVASGVKLTCTTFELGVALADATERGERFDIILLDVVMPGINGIETAAEIRRLNTHVKIIYLTSTPEFAVDSYAVGAYYYMLKPICEEIFQRILGKAYDEIKSRQFDSILISSNRAITRVSIFELAYCEIVNKTVSYHLTNGEIMESAGSITSLEQELLRYPYFAKTHRSYIVNLRHIMTLTSKQVILRTQEILPLARGRYDSIKRAYLSLPFTGGHV
jgi:DNA-binding LytR/AlgR family response regulator